MEVRPGYKMSDVGIIPEDWEEKTFVDVMTGFTSGQTPSRTRPDYFKGNIPWVTSGELNHNIITDTIEKITPEAVQNTNLKIIPKGTFLFAITGLEAEGTRGSCAITGIDATTNQSCMALYPSNALTTKYLFYYYERFGNWLAFRYCQGTKQQSYSGAIAKKLPIVYPPNLDEQCKITTSLSDIDSLITSLDRLVAKKRDIKIATMQELLTGKRRLLGFNGEWETTCLGKVGPFSKGRGIKKDDVLPEGIPCIRYGEIYTHHNDYIKKFYSFISENTAKESHEIKKGDLLFAGSGETTEDIGKCVAYLGDKRVYAGGDVIILSPNAGNSMYLSYLINSPSVASQKARMGQGEMIVHINAKNLAKIKVKTPLEKEQNAIATVLSDMDRELAALEQKRDKTKAIKQGMMQELLSGRIRLT